MANRDYYGDNAPQQLDTMKDTQQSDFANISESHTSQNPWMGNTANTEQGLVNQQTQWIDNNQANFFTEGPEGEKGLGATVLGGAGGAFVGHHVGKKSDHGKLGAVGGALAGAVVANLAESLVKGSRHGHGGLVRDRRRERLERKLDRHG
ncbi:hypothetical protein N7471_003247 [Penicillium samsonianum]|uniref:uncharacterized protein n=1 Tax=Penicillium samsonianum TaxID=1882272 RepID=UPI0025477134|nr:uncharacterized protein N7471_003247 [Penicillium samsonianum]KAJ6143794.1 hypothetical protein N7471_003247 [Penicillium samsonianum]